MENRKLLWNTQFEMIRKMDAVVEKCGIEWHQGGSDIRAVMLEAMHASLHEGYKQGMCDEIMKTCTHHFMYDRHGGQCLKCGQTTLQCSSD